MTNNIYDLAKGQMRGQPVPELVERLEMLLAEAKAGDLTGIIYAADSAQDGMIVRGHAGTHSYSMLGSLQVQVALLSEWIIEKD